MEIQRFRIQNYRAITDLSVSIAHEMIPIIGINESGKTTVLTAIRCFDWRSDRNDNGLHLVHKNRYAIGDKSPATVTASVYLTPSERKSLKGLIAEQHGGEHKFLDSGYEFLLTRTIPPAESGQTRPRPTPVESYSLDNDLDASISKKVVRFLRDLIPVVLYFDDFNDRVPDEIVLGTNYDPDRPQGRDKDKEWKDIVHEIFSRVGNPQDADSALGAYLTCADPLDQENTIDAITKVLNEDTIGEWKKLKKRNTALPDDADDLTLELKPSPNPQTNATHFSFLVKEKIGSTSSSFKVTERSKGFQWFFNYTMKLKFNSQYAGKDIKNAIFLLDEPGSYLHSRAQSELLSELQSVSENNTIVFCTHSQYLLDPRKIRLSSIYIAHKDDSDIELTRFGEYRESKTQGALSPVYAALDANFARDFIGRTALVEGISDYCLFQMAQNYYTSKLNDVHLIPGTGASTLSTLIALAIAFSDSYCILLDKDKDGEEAKKQYKKQFGHDCQNRTYLYGESKATTKFELESHLSKEDANALRTITGIKKLKKAILSLFYDISEDDRSRFWAQLSEETKSHIDDTIDATTRCLGI